MECALQCRQRIAIALAHLAKPSDLFSVFIKHEGLEVLLRSLESGDSDVRRHSSAAIAKLDARARMTVSKDAVVPKRPRVRFAFCFLPSLFPG